MWVEAKNQPLPLFSQAYCACTRNRISGPVMDRIDLIIRVGSLTAEEKFGTGGGERRFRNYSLPS